MFCKTPKTFNAVDVVFRLLIDQCFRVVHSVMLAETLKRVVTSERVSIVDRPLSCFLPDDGLVHSRDCLVVEAKIVRETISRLLLVEALDDGDFRAYPLQGLLSSTGLIMAPHVPARRLRDLERTAKNTLFTPQKVGRAPENVLFCCNHKDMLAPRGYETH
jgi:hypothetical protein